MLAFARNVLKLKPDDICFSVPKMFFAYGFGNSITFPFSAGAATLLLPGQPKPAAIFEAIGRFRPSVFFGLPTLYTSLTKADGAAAADFSSLRMALSAAEVLSAEVFNGWKTLTGLEIVEGLGSTEVLHIYLSNRPEQKKLGAAGLRVPGYEIVLRDKDGREVGDNEEGILWVRGDSNTPLYWNRPDKTAETIREAGWIYTGDRFVRDSDGFHFFRGRADDLIKISGQWVYPLEVELCLAEHPDVRECAVFAAELPDRRMTLKAVVVMNDSAFDESDATKMLQDFVKAKLLPYKYPREIEVHRRIAEDRHRQDRPPGGDADLGSSPQRCQTSSRRKPGPITTDVCCCARWPLQPSPNSAVLWVPAQGRDDDSIQLPQPRAAIQPGQIAILILRRLRAHDGVADAGVLAGGVIDVLADGARQQLHPRGARKALRAIVLQRGRRDRPDAHPAYATGTPRPPSPGRRLARNIAASDARRRRAARRGRRPSARSDRGRTTPTAASSCRAG